MGGSPSRDVQENIVCLCTLHHRQRTLHEWRDEIRNGHYVKIWGDGPRQRKAYTIPGRVIGAVTGEGKPYSGPASSPRSLPSPAGASGASSATTEGQEPGARMQPSAVAPGGFTSRPEQDAGGGDSREFLVSLPSPAAVTPAPSVSLKEQA